MFHLFIKKVSTFTTFTCHRWLPLIALSDGYEAVYNFFTVLQQKGHTVVAYVIMPNHIHMLMHYNGGRQSLNTVIGNGKRFMAYDIVERLSKKGQDTILQQLQNGVGMKDKQRGKKHDVWKDSFDMIL